jgi:hypothetical protein
MGLKSRPSLQQQQQQNTHEQDNAHIQGEGTAEAAAHEQQHPMTSPDRIQNNSSSHDNKGNVRFLRVLP